MNPLERDRKSWAQFLDELRDDMIVTRTLYGDDADFNKVKEIRDLAVRLWRACDNWEATAKEEARLVREKV